MLFCAILNWENLKDKNTETTYEYIFKFKLKSC